MGGTWRSPGETVNWEGRILPNLAITPLGESVSMSDLNRGIMKFDGADKPFVVALSAMLVLGSITALIVWALRVAYAVH